MDIIANSPKLRSASKGNALDLCRFIRDSLDSDKAEDISIIDLSGKCSFADAMVVASGRSQRHVGALATKLRDTLREKGFSPLSLEGMESCDWVLIDVGDVVVHIFRPETREFYHLERMWAVPAPAAATESMTSGHRADAFVPA